MCAGIYPEFPCFEYNMWFLINHNNSAHYLPTANRRLPSMTKTASMKTSKALETPKAKAQGEVDYKAKIDVVIEAFSAKVTLGPAPTPAPLCLHLLSPLSLDSLGLLTTDHQAGRGDDAQVQGTRPANATTLTHLLPRARNTLWPGSGCPP